MLFYSPVAWLILVVFGVQSGMLFADMMKGMVWTQEMGYPLSAVTYRVFADPMYGGVFARMQSFLYFYIPLLTMGLVSRELSSGSIRLLYSSPITNFQIIMGKYLSMMIYGAFMMGILLLAILALGFCLMERQTKKLIEPINQLDLEHPLEHVEYEELRPLLNRALMILNL